MSSIVQTSEIATRHRVLLAVSLAVAVLWALMSFAASPAIASYVYPFDGELGQPPTSFTGEATEDGVSVAVDDADGDAYVANPENAAEVDVFETSSGTQLTPLLGSSTPAGSFGGGHFISVAADDGTGAVYVLDSENDVVDVFETTGKSGKYKCQITGSATPSPTECNGVAGSGTATGALNEPTAIAVDQSTGEIYVLDGADDVVDVFSSGGAYLREFSLAPIPDAKQFEALRGIAVDDLNGRVYVADEGEGLVYVFVGATGAHEATWSGANTPAGSFGEGHGKVSVAADNATGRVYVSDSHDGVVDVFDSSGNYLPAQFEAPLGKPLRVTFDQESARLYVASGTAGKTVVKIFGPGTLRAAVVTGPVSNLLPTSLTFNGSVNPEAVTLKECAFEYVSDATLEELIGQNYEELVEGKVLTPEIIFEAVGVHASCEEPEADEIIGSSPVAVHANVNGLQEGVTYHYRLNGENANGSSFGTVDQFTMPSPPAIDGARSENVTGSTADLVAQINPDNAATTYHFQYTTEEQFAREGFANATSIPVPEGEIPAGLSGQTVTQHVTGLEPNITYHWRLVAHNVAGTTTGVDHTFIYNTTGAGLPDGREYEMVTPPFKNGALLGSAQPLALSSTISEGGTRLIRSDIQCFDGAVSCPALTGGVLGTLYQFERTAAGWVVTPLAPPATEFEENVGWGGNSNTGMALFSMPTVSGEEDLYLRPPGSPASFIDVGPLTEPGKESIHVEHQGTPTGSHVVFALEDKDKWSFDATTGEVNGNGTELSLYEYAGTGNSHPVLVGVTGGLGSDALISRCATYYGEPHQSSPADGYAVSEDGSTIFFTAHACTGGSGVNETTRVEANTLYARIDKSETVKISAPFAPGCEPSCQSSKPVVATFQGASVDGARAFFTSAQRLTDQATEGEESNDENLYEAEIGKNGGGASEVKSLIAVSAGDTSGNGPRVQGVMATAPDGSHTYFVARAALTNEERLGCKAEFEAASEPEEGRCHATEGANNLYVFERDASYPQGHLAFIAPLSSAAGSEALKLESDSQQWSAAGGGQANVTPEGRYLVFASDARLTADDTDLRQARQVFRYDASTGELVRISIGADGFNDNGNAAAADAEIVHPGGAGNLAGPPRSDSTMSQDGQYVFFQSPVSLTPQALNEVPIAGSGSSEHLYAQNVYEYHEGHVYLISDGHDTASEHTTCTREVPRSLDSAVCLIGTDTTGRNVFFTTADPLVRADTDTQLDIYDARICGDEGCIQSAPPPSPPCLGEACHGTPSAIPAVPGVPSVSFSGGGNVSPPPPPPPPPVSKPLTKAQKLAKALKSCRSKPNKHKRTVCEAQARKRYGAKAKKSAHIDRKVSR